MMRTVFIRLLVLILVATPVSWVHAQDDSTGSNCDINLESLILSLVQAQREADAGNNFNAVQTMKQAQADLATLVTDCQGALYPLPKSFTAPDKSITFHYPEGWVLTSISGGGYAVASSQALANAIASSELDSLAAGDQMLVALPMPLGDDPANFESFVEDFEDDNLVPAFSDVSQISMQEVNGQAARRYTIRDDSLAGFVVLIDYTGLEAPAVLMLAAFAAPSESAQIEPILAAFETTVKYPASLRPSGAALDDLQYVEAIPVTEISDAINFRAMALSPDGSRIVWFNQDDNQICVTPIDAPTDTFCDPLPDNFGGRPPMLHWSPDSRTVAFTTDFFRLFIEADIMLYDVEGRSVVDATDDRIDKWRLGGGVSEGDSTGPMWIDAVMTWGPDGYLYFWRDELADPADMDHVQSGIYRLKPGDSQAVLVRDMTGMYDRFSLFYAYDYSLDGTMSVSPDASQIALIIRSQDRESPDNGVWIVSLTDPEAAPQHVAAYADLRAGLPSDENPDMMLDPTGVTWGDNGLYVTANNYAYGNISYGLAYFIDLKSGAITPLIDFSSMTRQEVLTVDEATGRSPQFEMPRSAVLAPDASGLITFSMALPNAGLWSLRLVDGQGEQTLLYEIKDYAVVPSTIACIAQDGTALLYGYLFRPAK